MKSQKKCFICWGCVLLILALAVGGPISGQNMPVVQVVPMNTTVAVGQTVDILVNIENVSQLYGVEMAVLFDANVIEVVDADSSKDGVQIAVGGLFNPGFEDSNKVIGGRVEYIFAQLNPSPPVDGSGTLIKITFRGKAAGTSALTLETMLLSDPNGQRIPATLQSGSLTVGDGTAPTLPPPTATPAPTAVPVQTAVPTPTTAPVAPTPAPTPLATQVPVITGGANCGQIQGYHLVQKGETVYAIGRTYATLPRAIITCNRLVNPTNIHRSNQLAIPVAPWIPTPPGPTVPAQFTPQNPTSVCRYTHIVGAKETLTQLGGRYGVNLWAIVRSNNIQNPNLIYIGQALCIP